MTSRAEKWAHVHPPDLAPETPEGLHATVRADGGCVIWNHGAGQASVTLTAGEAKVLLAWMAINFADENPGSHICPPWGCDR